MSQTEEKEGIIEVLWNFFLIYIKTTKSLFRNDVL